MLCKVLVIMKANLTLYAAISWADLGYIYKYNKILGDIYCRSLHIFCVVKICEKHQKYMNNSKFINVNLTTTVQQRFCSMIWQYNEVTLSLLFGKNNLKHFSTGLTPIPPIGIQGFFFLFQESFPCTKVQAHYSFIC